MMMTNSDLRENQRMAAGNMALLGAKIVVLGMVFNGYFMVSGPWPMPFAFGVICGLIALTVAYIADGLIVGSYETAMSGRAKHFSESDKQRFQRRANYQYRQARNLLPPVVVFSALCWICWLWGAFSIY